MDNLADMMTEIIEMREKRLERSKNREEVVSLDESYNSFEDDSDTVASVEP